jgi:hypothetical protein
LLLLKSYLPFQGCSWCNGWNTSNLSWNLPLPLCLPHLSLQMDFWLRVILFK